MLPRTFIIPSSTLKKTLAGSLSLVLFLTNCALANTHESLFYSRRKNVIAKLPSPQSQHLLQNILPAQPSSFTASPTRLGLKNNNRFSTLMEALPLQAGTLRIVEKGSSIKTIIHIQDIHQNLEAQKNISAAVSAMSKTKKNLLVALEGSSEKIDLSAFHEFPRQDIVTETAQHLLRSDKISGPVYASFTTPQSSVVLHGVEDQNLYDSNVTAFRESYPFISKTKKELENISRKLAREKESTWNKTLFHFDAKIEAYRQNAMPLGLYAQLLNERVAAPTNNVEVFLQASLLEGKINFNQANTERSHVLEQLANKLPATDISALTEKTIAYRIGHISHGQFYAYLKDLCRHHGVSLKNAPAFNDFLQYVILAEAIRSDDLFVDLQKMENAAYAKLIHSKKEEDLYQRSKVLHLTQKLVDFSLTSNEWEEYKRTATSKLQLATGSRKDPFQSPFSSRQSLNLSSFERFYSLAEQRNGALVQNLFQAMEENQTDIAVLVTGGFHSFGIGEELKKGGVTFASFTPRITKVENTSGVEALSVFTQEKTPLDQLFEGQKLFLAKPGITRSVANEAAVQTAAAAAQDGKLAFSIIDRLFTKVTSWDLVSIRNLANNALVIWKNATGQHRALVTPNKRILILNSTFVLAPFATLIHLTISSFLNQSSTVIATALIYLTYKTAFFVFTIFHELGHAVIDGNLSSTNLPTLRNFILGTDVQVAFIQPGNHGIWRNRAVALAGLFVTISLSVLGGNLLINNFLTSGLILLITNTILLAANFKWSKDLWVLVTGESVPVLAMATSEKIASRLTTEFTVDLQEGPEGQAQIRNAISIAMNELPSAFGAGTTENARISEFLEKSLNHALKRNLTTATITRLIENNRLVFRVIENIDTDLALNSEIKKDWSEFKESIAHVNGQFLQSPQQGNNNFYIYEFSLPFKKSLPERFRPAMPYSAENIDTLLGTPLTPEELTDVSFLLTESPNEIETKSLFYLIEYKDTDLAQKAAILLASRLQQYDTWQISHLSDFLIRTLQKNISKEIMRLSALALKYVAPKRRFPLSIPMIEFNQLHKTKLATPKNKKFKISVTSSMDGTVSVRVHEDRYWLFKLIGYAIPKWGSIKTQRGTFTFKYSPIEEDNNLEENLRTVSLSYNGNLDEDILKQFILTWSQVAPQGSTVQYANPTNEVAFSYTSMGKAFLDAGTGFSVKAISDTTVTLKKQDAPTGNSGAGYARSMFGKGRSPVFLTIITLGLYPVLRYGVDFADEFLGHMIAAKALGFETDTEESDLLRFNPIYRYHIQEDRPKRMAFISIFPPAFIWLPLATWSAQLWLQTPEVFFAFDSFWGGVGTVFGPWYMLFASFGQIASYYATWNSSITEFSSEDELLELNDVQRFWLQIWSTLPVGTLAGTARSQFLKSGHLWRNLRALVLALIALIPQNITAATVQDILLESKKTTSISESEQYDLSEKSLVLFNRYKEKLKRNFSNKVAEAAHNNDANRDINTLWEKITDPKQKVLAKQRQVGFVALVMIVHAGIRDLGKSEDDFNRALWMLMKLVDFNEKGDIGPSYENRPLTTWADIQKQANAVRKQLPKLHGTARSQFFKWSTLDSPPTQTLQPKKPSDSPTRSSRDTLPRTIYVFPGGDGSGGPLGDQVLGRVISNLLAQWYSSEKSKLQIPGTNNNLSQQTNSKADQNSAGANPRQSSSLTAPVVDVNMPQTNTGNNLPSNQGAGQNRVGKNRNLTIAAVQQVETLKAQASNFNPSLPTTFNNNSNPTQLDRRAFRPLTRLPYVFAAIGFASLSLVGLTQLFINGTFGFEITRASLTYLTYFGGVLFSLSLIGKRSWGELMKSSDTSGPWLEIVLGPKYSSALGEAERNQEGRDETTEAFDRESYVIRALAGMEIDSGPKTEASSASENDLPSQDGTEPTSAQEIRRAATREVLQVIVNTVEVLANVSNQNPMSILNALNALQQSSAPTLDASILMQMAKLSKQRALLTAVYRSLSRNDSSARAQIKALDSTPALPFLVFRDAALVLKNELIIRIGNQRKTSESAQFRQLRILQRLLRDPKYLDKVSVDLIGNQGLVPILPLDGTARPGQPLRVEIDKPRTESLDSSFSTIEETEAEADLALLSAVEAAVEVLVQKSAISKGEILRRMVNGQLSETDMKLVLEFVTTSLKAVESKSTQVGTTTKLNATQINAKIQNAANFLLSEIEPQPSGQREAESRILNKTNAVKSGAFTTIAHRIAQDLARTAAAVALASSLAAATAASQVNTSVQAGLNKAAATAVFSVAPTPGIENQATPTPTTNGPAVSAAEMVIQKTEPKQTATTNKNNNLERLAEDLITLVRATANTRETDQIDIDRVLPTIGSLGLNNNDVALALQILTADEQVELEILLAEKIQALANENRLTSAEVQALMSQLYLNTNQRTALKNIIGNKDVGLPIKSSSDIQLVRTVLEQFNNPQQKLILFVSPSDAIFFSDQLAELITQGTVVLKTVGAVSKQGEKFILSFQQLAVGLSGMNEAERQNLVVLLEDGVSWDTKQLVQLKVLGSIGFALTKDFISGVPVRKMDIQFILRLAKTMGVQA